MDFFQICVREVKGGGLEVYPDFVVGRSKDLMVRGKSFYAIWDEPAGLWSTDEYDVQRIVDDKLRSYARENSPDTTVKFMRSFSSNAWNQFRKYMSQVSDNSHNLDENLTWANTAVKKTDYVSRRLPYNLEAGDHSAWDELMETLYAPAERAKIEWAIGAIVSGDSKKIQKFVVLYGSAGTGKSTVLNIIQDLFSGYTTTFEAKALGSNGGAFATEVFKANPLVAIQHDGDLSRIEDNTRLNQIVSHEDMTLNEKYKPSYTSRINAFLFMGTNTAVKITDSRSGIIRRLIDVHPTGNKIPTDRYHLLMDRIKFELGAIATHCLDVYKKMGKNFYNGYEPTEMMFQTDVFFNFIEFYLDVFKSQDGVTLQQAYTMYKEYCGEAGIDKPMPRHKFRSELQNYFAEVKERALVNGAQVRNWYSGFKGINYKTPVAEEPQVFSLVLEETVSTFDRDFAHLPAQYAKADGSPATIWDKVTTTLGGLDTSQLHYVRVDLHHIVIDFDLTDENGEKSLERNLEAAASWPATYAELSKSGKAVHLHYLYDGDPSELAAEFEPGIEIKVYSGKSSLRRRLSLCNNMPVATINSGLPMKEKKVLTSEKIQSVQGLRALIERNLRKEIHPGTKPSIDFIYKILEDAYISGMEYDVTDMRQAITVFANSSTNQPLQALKVVTRMRFKSEGEVSSVKDPLPEIERRLVFYDIEVYPNPFVVCWKYEGSDNVVRMINPSPQEIEQLLKMKLVGFNVRRYDNHILYARMMGYTNEELYKLSSKIINDKSAQSSPLFGEAYGLSYTDIYDFSSKKQGLKKFQIDLGIHHVEMDIPWDEPVPEELWPKVVEYCVNDVVSSEKVFEARKQDFVARQILAGLSGLTVNDTTAKHTAKIIFGNDRNPQRSFVYTDLSKDFPGYTFDATRKPNKSDYRGEDPSEGGYVYAEPGVYHDVAVLDVASMHPTSIRQLNLFGEYTPNFAALVDARLAIKHGDFDAARKMLNGKLAPFLTDEADADALAYALKIVINIVYGLTSAKFDNPFRDLRNVDNIVAKRGALFMIDLKHEVQQRGFTVAHIKTDSIKIPNATPEIIEFVTEFGKKYGYDFEHEATYERMALVNDAVYVAKYGWAEKEKLIGTWTAVGAQFQHPYVFKTLFHDGEGLGFDDFCETKQVQQGIMYLDFDGAKPMASVSPPASMHHVGRIGRFVPVKDGYGGGHLYRVQDDKSYAVAGTKGFQWVEAELAKDLPHDAIDMDYFDGLVTSARNAIEKYGVVDFCVG